MSSCTQRSCELSLAKPHEAWRLDREEAPSTGAVLRDGSHMLTACYDASGTALGKRTIQVRCRRSRLNLQLLSGGAESVTMEPDDVPVSDIVAHAVRTNNIRFLVREVRARAGNYYLRRDEIGTLQVGSQRATPASAFWTKLQMHAHVLLQMSLESVSVREEPEGMIAIQLASGLRCVLAVGHDYPRAHAALRIARWEDSNG